MDLCVAELIRNDYRKWDVEKLSSLLNEKDVGKILAIRLSNTSSEDCWIWKTTIKDTSQLRVLIGPGIQRCMIGWVVVLRAIFGRSRIPLR